MRHYCSFSHPFGSKRGEATGDVFERQPMKPVAANAAFFKMSGKGKTARGGHQTVMESGIEASDLQQARLQGLHRPDRRQAARLV